MPNFSVQEQNYTLQNIAEVAAYAEQIDKFFDKLVLTLYSDWGPIMAAEYADQIADPDDDDLDFVEFDADDFAESIVSHSVQNIKGRTLVNLQIIDSNGDFQELSKFIDEDIIKLFKSKPHLWEW
jgi:hypothetical protein